MAIYMWREQSWWQPNANTLAYLPLATDITDQTGNYTLTSQNITFSNNKAVFNNAGTSCITFPATMTNNTFTLHQIIQITDFNGYQLAYRHSDNLGFDDSRCYLYGYSSITLALGTYSTATWISPSTWEHLYSFVVQNNQMKFYIDGVLKYTKSGTVWSYTDAQLSLWNRFYNMNEWLRWTMREVILESSYRTDAEVLALAQQFGFAS